RIIDYYVERIEATIPEFPQALGKGNPFQVTREPGGEWFNYHGPNQGDLTAVQGMLAYLAHELRESGPDSLPFAETGGFQKSLESIADLLRAKGASELADTGPLAHLIIQAKTFGFHLAALDIRQHSSVHEKAVSTVLRAAGVTSAYAQLSEEEKRQILDSEIRHRRPLIGRNQDL